jgi:6-phospho-beta-glucosidase
MLTLRTVPVMLNIAREMERRCPNAWMFIFTNPESVLTDAVRRYSPIRAVGLCEGERNIRYDVNMALRAKIDAPRPETDELAKDVAQAAGGVPLMEMDYRVAGINHLGWAYECTWQGKDIYPKLKERMARADRARLPEWMHWYLDTVALYGRFICASAHCFHWLYHQRMMEHLAAGLHSSKKQRSQKQDTNIAEAAKLVDEDLGDGFWEHPLLARMGDKKGFDDLGVGVMSAMLANTGEERVVTVLNQGMVSNLPEGVPVEVTVRVDANGIHALPPADVPWQAQSLLAAILAHQRMVADVAIEGTRSNLLTAILADPIQRNRDVAEHMMDDLLAANRPWLPKHLQES